MSSWSSDFLGALKDNDVRLVSYVPDKVLTPLIDGAGSDGHFDTVVATREDEALAMVAGAWMGGMRGIVMMQTSGFGVIPNALASLIVPSQIPAVLVVSERGVLGEFNPGQVLVTRTLRPTLDSIAVTHHTLAEGGNLPFMVDRALQQAYATLSPVVFILSPLLTGGKVFTAEPGTLP